MLDENSISEHFSTAIHRFFDPKHHMSDDFHLLDRGDVCDINKITLSSPYSINGLEFQGVILIGVDDGRVPQTSGTSDISKHFLMYSSYNMLYLSISRARYMVSVLGSKLNGISPCLEHSIAAEYIEQA